MEQRKDMVGFECFYMVSCNGEVFNVRKNRYSKISPGNNGYPRVKICAKGIDKYKLVHRLVAEAFLPNPKGLSFVNHKDCNPLNNNVDNLEWCTSSYNSKYAFNLGRRKAPDNRVGVIQYDKLGNKIRTWDSMMDVERELGFFSTGISAVCRGTQKSAYGYIWKYVYTN